MSERYSTFKAPRGGIMTTEVGAITGELELHTAADENGLLALHIRYAGADEWYTIEGSPYQLHDARDADVLHTILIEMLHRPQP
ncbi:hypothetical protein [Streptomyces harbinensis]|uniref:Uncharacterized protein n=1 Tax=Streptomyces harbinensis TaxID=1176198 RepID=A0A1I6NT66_9ACTN|nr:hypothetical protein [Streptomyces harbinensis]QKV70324.1 hypothetical protein HUT13_17270 [Streptomyces harbinensis]SFS31048.1 hypothetical protein SAMN05444716_1018 [Streptomyces harbinensis]